jgi:hypothetical protein
VRVMVIENFREGAAKAVYRRFDERGRLMPDGLVYIDSWVDASLERCFQLVECSDVALLEQWAQHWSDLVEFEFVPVVTSAEARAALEVAQ